MAGKHEIQNILDSDSAFWISRVRDLFAFPVCLDFDIQISKFDSWRPFDGALRTCRREEYPNPRVFASRKNLRKPQKLLTKGVHVSSVVHVSSGQQGDKPYSEADDGKGSQS